MTQSSREAHFFTSSLMEGRDWKGLELAACRLLGHAGWRNLQYVGQAGDKGADILAVRFNRELGIDESYLFQVKAVSGNNYVGLSALDEALKAQAFYKAKITVVVTNGDYRSSV